MIALALGLAIHPVLDGRMVHLDAAKVDRLLTDLVAGQGFKTVDIQVLVRGLCRGRKVKAAN